MICRGFFASARTISRAEGLADPRLIEYPPPNIGVQSPGEIYENAKKLLDDVIKALTNPVTGAPKAAAEAKEEEAKKIVCKGTLGEVDEFFLDNRWTDGCPIIPPTLEAVSKMLRYTDRSPDEVLGILPPGMRQATVWHIAVNGVMAGCRPEYMPVLLAVVEAIAEPKFRLQDAGTTGGSTSLIIINGPIIKELNFNYGEGVLRPERQANTTIGRFLQLCKVNIARYLTGITDMASFGRSYHPVLAEAEDASPWEPLSVERGFKPGSNVVTVLLSGGSGTHFVVNGANATENLQSLAQEVSSRLSGSIIGLLRWGPEINPLIGVAPVIASIIASAGYTKSDFKKYLYDNGRIPAHEADERIENMRRGRPNSVCDAVEMGILPKLFCETEDPNRMLPVIRYPEDFLVVVTGGPNRNRGFILSPGGNGGLPVSKEIKLPKNWGQLPKKKL